mmetsp:Transcript_68356/g.164017  ORF Transcript_68356/g.164017 Transcript_68356/m.164017 type:complete len:279 (-) Transcript_68356:1190-2026(-)
MGYSMCTRRAGSGFSSRPQHLRHRGNGTSSHSTVPLCRLCPVSTAYCSHANGWHRQLWLCLHICWILCRAAGSNVGTTCWRLHHGAHTIYGLHRIHHTLHANGSKILAGCHYFHYSTYQWVPLWSNFRGWHVLRHRHPKRRGLHNFSVHSPTTSRAADCLRRHKCPSSDDQGASCRATHNFSCSNCGCGFRISAGNTHRCPAGQCLCCNGSSTIRSSIRRFSGDVSPWLSTSSCCCLTCEAHIGSTRTQSCPSLGGACTTVGAQTGPGSAGICSAGVR